MEERTRYLVDDLVIDPVRGNVSRDGNEIPLPRLSYDLLLALVESSPKLLSQDELTAKVWPGLVVSPETVSQRVKLLRDALGDDPKAPKYIVGVRGRGYQLKFAATKETAAETVGSRSTPATVASDSAEPAHLSQTLPAASNLSWWRRPGAALLALPLLGAGLLMLYTSGYWAKKREVLVTTAEAFKPPSNSVAVLAFTNMSGDSRDEYFSDGIAEELLDTLARVNELQVAARTSSFSFKHQEIDVREVARRLNVAAILEGSVRRLENRVRISAQLVNAATGYELWSQTYDRDMRDIFAVQSDIAEAVASKLRVSLLHDATARRDGTTRNPQALDAYLRALAYRHRFDQPSERAELAEYDEALMKDPLFGLAHAGRAKALIEYADEWEGDATRRAELRRQARASADRAIELAPESGDAYVALAMVTLQTTYDYRATESAYRHALSVEPGNAVVQSSYASEAGRIGFPNALDAANRAIVLNPLDSGSYAARGEVLYSVRRYAEARQSFIEAERLGSDSGTGHLGRAMTALAMGRPQEALDICEKHTEGWGYQTCLAIAYCKLGRQPDRQRIQAMMRAEQGDLLAYQYAQIASQCNSQQEALRWLETAYRLRDAGLWDIRTDPMLDPIREAPDFKRVLAELNFPP